MAWVERAGASTCADCSERRGSQGDFNLKGLCQLASMRAKVIQINHICQNSTVFKGVNFSFTYRERKFTATFTS